MSSRTLRGQVAVAGVGQTEYYKWGQAPDPEFKLAIQAILTRATTPVSRQPRSMASRRTATIAARHRACRLRSASTICG